MNMFKTLLAYVFAGAWLGGALASWLGPTFLEWYNTAGAEFGTQTVCDVPKIIRLVTGKLIGYQLVGSGIGALTALVLGILIVRTLARRRAAQTPAV